MDFEIEDSGEDQDLYDDPYDHRRGGGYGNVGYGSGGGVRASNSSAGGGGVRRSTGSGFFSAGNDEDGGDDYDFEYDEPQQPQGRIAAFSPAAVSRKGGNGSSGGGHKDFDVSSDYESSHDSYPAQQRKNAAAPAGGLRLSVTSQESALEKAQNMLNRYSQKGGTTGSNKPSSYSEPSTNFKAKKSAHFDEDDLSMDEESDEDEREDDDDEAYMDISDSADRLRENFSKSRGPSSAGMGLKKSPATASLLPSKTITSTTSSKSNAAPSKDVKGFGKMMDDSNVSHIVHEESVHEYEDDDDVIDEEHNSEEGEDIVDEYGDEEFDKNEEEDELGESIAQDDDEEPVPKVNNKSPNVALQKQHISIAQNEIKSNDTKAMKGYEDDDYEDDDDEANENASYSRMVYGQEEDVDSVEVDEDYTESSKPKIFSFTDLGDIAGWEPAASTNNVFNDLSQVSKPVEVVSSKTTTSNQSNPTTSAEDNKPKPAVVASKPVTIDSNTTRNVPSTTVLAAAIVPSVSYTAVSQPQASMVTPATAPPLSAPTAPPALSPSPTDSNQSPPFAQYPYPHAYYPPPQVGGAPPMPPTAHTPPTPGYPPYPYPPMMSSSPYGYPHYGYYPPMPPPPPPPHGYGYSPYPYPVHYGYPAHPPAETIYPNHHTVTNNGGSIRTSSSVLNNPALAVLGNQPIVLELLKELSKVQEEANWARTKLAETLMILKETGQSLPSKHTTHSQLEPQGHQMTKTANPPSVAASKGRYNSNDENDAGDEEEYSQEYSEDFDVSQLNLSTSYRGSHRNSPGKKINGNVINNKMLASFDDHDAKDAFVGGNKKSQPPPMPQLREEDHDDTSGTSLNIGIESKGSPHQVPKVSVDVPSHRFNPPLSSSAAFGGRFSSFAGTNEFLDPFADSVAKSFMASQELLRTKLDSLRLKIQMTNKMSLERDELEEFTMGKHCGISEETQASSLDRLKMQFESKRRQSEDRLKKLLTECYPDLNEEEVMKMAKLVE